MIPQMIEVIDKYDVDGFWVDGENWGSKPCWCDRCRAEYTRRTGLAGIPYGDRDPGWNEWLTFHRDLFIEHVRRYADAVHARKPQCMVCSNWMYSARQPDPVLAPVDYLSGDYSWSWGAARAAVEGRVLDGRQMSWDLMAWGFTKAGEMRGEMPWVMKTATHLCQEVSEVVALGGAIMVYNTPQRTGWLTGWHQALLAEIAAFCRARQETCWHSETVPQAAVLHLANHFYRANDPLYNYGTGMQPVEGALHALLETQRSVDILIEETALERMAAYKLAVVPEQTRLSVALVDALETYARAGGSVLLSGAHLARECPALVGALPHGEAIDGTIYLGVEGRAVGVPGPWQPVIPQGNVNVWACRFGEQEPAKDATADVIVTRRVLGKGQIVGIHGPVFGRYLQGHYPLLRRFISHLVARLDIPWLVTVKGPARLEVIVRQKSGPLLVNLINRGAGEALHPQRVIVEELPPIEDVVLYIRLEDRPRAISLMPGERPLDWSYADGTATVRVPQVDVHDIVVVER
jgi:hypothetical protein